MKRIAWRPGLLALMLLWLSVPWLTVVAAELTSIEQAETVSKTTGRPILALAGSKS